MSGYLHEDGRSGTFCRIVWASAAVILLSAALAPIAERGRPLKELSSNLGAAMLLTGCLNLLVCRIVKNRLHGVRWLLVDGVTTTLLSLFPLLNEMVITAVIPFFFGIWELFSGILKFFDAVELRRENVHGWKCFCAFGCIEVLSGVAALLKPIEEFAGMHTVVAAVFFIQSCSYLLKSVSAPRLLDTGTKES